MKDYDELWEQYARGFVDKLNKSGDSDWSKLDETEQEMQMQDKPNQTAMMYTNFTVRSWGRRLKT